MAMELQKPKEKELPQEAQQKPHQNLPDKAGPNSENPHQDQPQGGEAMETKPPNPSDTVSSPPLVSDLQKKQRRAERFGMPVQLSEEEKRSSRAERFGTGPPMHGLEESKKLEQQKRKARAERFGLVAHSVDDEEAKKKARLARFSGNAKSDSVDEEKKKARAIRFSQTPATTSMQANGKANEQVILQSISNLEKATIVGKAGGLA